MTEHAPAEPEQQIYRQLLQALSHPGRLYHLPAGPWASSMEALARTLLDHEVSFCVLPGAPAEWELTIARQTKARLAPPDEADYLFISGVESNGTILQAKRGTPDVPDRGATLIYITDEERQEREGPGPFLSGPGLSAEQPPQRNPLTPDEWRTLQEANAEFPLGLDVFCLIGPDRLLGLPRSTRIRME